MDTLLILLLLYGLFKKFNKAATQKGKQSKRGKNAPKRAVEAIRSQVEQRKQEAQQMHMNDLEPDYPSEGESFMAFTQDAHGCISESQEYMGSLNADTSEGEDACDLELGHERLEEIEPESVYAAQIGTQSPLDFSPQALYKGVVMSEILTRPSQRRTCRF